VSQDPYFFTPPQAPSLVAPASIVPSRVGYAPPAPPVARHAAPKPPKQSRGWLVAVAAGVVVVLALVVGFVVLAHKDKHTEGNALLRPIQQADKVQLDSDLRLASTAEESWFAEHGSYTSDLGAAGYRSNGSARIAVVSAGGSSYCLRATNASAHSAEYYNRGTGLSSTPCH
jgi:hypothetical protein